MNIIRPPANDRKDGAKFGIANFFIFYQRIINDVSFFSLDITYKPDS